jgi:DNA-directed RNA polymerase specialized sigma24 family protein
MPIDIVDDAMSEAFLYAYSHWDRVSSMNNSAGFLFRVAQSKSRRRRQGVLPAPSSDTATPIDPALIRAVQSLPPKQRSSVWLVHACGWTYAEAAEALGLSRSAVGTHVTRGLENIRKRLKETHHD